MVRLEEYAQADLAVPELRFCTVSAPLVYALLCGIRCLQSCPILATDLLKEPLNSSAELQKKKKTQHWPVKIMSVTAALK